MLKKTCRVCLEEFISTNKKKIYCNRKCALFFHNSKRGLESPLIKNCPVCFENFEIKNNFQMYCSKTCSAYVVKASKYGLDTHQLIEMLAGGCEACGATEKLVVDHDHSCCPGKNSCGACVRGILCSPCNLAEGILNGDPARAIALTNYMLKNIKEI